MKITRPFPVFAVSWLVLITLLLCIPGTKFPKVQWQDKIMLDKLIHIILFWVLVTLWCKAFGRRNERNFIVITILAVLYGMIMELVQHYFIPYRSFDFGDMIANSIGSVAGYFIAVKRMITH